MSGPDDGAPAKLTGADLQSRFDQGMTNATMFLVGKTTPANAVTMLPSSAVALAVTEGPQQKTDFTPPAYTPPKMALT